MKGPYLEQHELEQLEVLLPHAIRDTLRGWKSNRLRGASASMAFYGNISNSLLKAFDELAAEIKPQPKSVQFKCTVIDDAHPNGIPLEQWAEPQRTEQNFCSRCGKRTADLSVIHTCTPPQENT